MLVFSFSAGAAFHAFTSQLKDLLGVRLPQHQGPLNIPLTYYDLALSVPKTKLAAVAVSTVTITILAINNEIVKVVRNTNNKMSIKTRIQLLSMRF